MSCVGRDFNDPVVPTTLAPIMTDNEKIFQSKHVSRKCSKITIILWKESVIFYTPNRPPVLSSKLSNLLHIVSHVLHFAIWPSPTALSSNFLLWCLQHPDVCTVTSRSFSWSVLLAKVYIQALVICLQNITKAIFPYFVLGFHLIKQIIKYNNKKPRKSNYFEVSCLCH